MGPEICCLDISGDLPTIKRNPPVVSHMLQNSGVLGYYGVVYFDRSGQN